MDLYQEITDRIIEQMERGIILWEKPWVSSGSAVSYATGKPYSLLNQLLLGRPGEYATFRQIQQAGGRVKKGEKLSMVVFWKWIEQEDEETDSQEGAQATSGGDTTVPQPRSCDAKRGSRRTEVPFLRYYNVFHIDQCEGLTAKYLSELPDAVSPDKTADAVIARYVSASGVKLVHESGDRAFYRPSSDCVTLPLPAQFRDTAEYYSTAFHELTHSTGYASRLNRLEKTAFFGSEAYSKEELIAEIGAAALVNRAGLETPGSVRNNAAYVQNWLQVLRNDKRVIVSAAGKAEKAVNLILGAGA